MLLILVLISLSFAVAVMASRKLDKVTPEAGEEVPVSVSDMEVITIDSFPVEASVRISGVQGDSCSGEYNLKQSINSFYIDLELTRIRQDIKCVEEGTPFDETFKLDILGLSKGLYTVKLGDLQSSLELPIDNSTTLSDESVALGLYTIKEEDFFTGHIFYPKVPSFLSEFKNEIIENSIKGPNTGGYYFTAYYEDEGYALFYLPTGAMVLSGAGDNIEVFYEKHSLVFVVKKIVKNTETSDYYLLSTKGTKPELITEIKN